MSVPTPTSGPRWKRRYLARLIAGPWTLRARRSKALRAYLDAHGYITPHFTWQSYACTDGTPVPGALRPNAIRLHWRLEILRHRLGDCPVTVDGPYRTEARNIAVGGARDSRHVHADAADFFVAQVERWIAHGARIGRGAKSRAQVLRLAGRTFYNGGLGNENSGTLHVDARGFKARFVTWVGAHA
jgi:peptidase M15-like protein